MLHYNPDNPHPTIGGEICPGTLVGTDAQPRLSGNVRSSLKSPELLTDSSGPPMFDIWDIKSG